MRGFFGFNGAAPRGARKSHSDFVFLRQLSSFNGAAPRGARKYAGCRSREDFSTSLQRGRATGGAEIRRSSRLNLSSGLLQRGRATGGAEIRQRTHAKFHNAGLQRGRATGARKCHARENLSYRDCLLQRGRATGGAEIAFDTVVEIRAFIASTGPRHGGRGNSRMIVNLVSPPSSFNGAAPRGARKSATDTWVTAPKNRLQRGRATGGAEIHVPPSPPTRRHNASTGPRHGGRGNMDYTHPRGPARPRFNGAAPRGARK